MAGTVAAGVWSLQTPLDHRVFGVPYDDAELLGKAVTRGPASRPIGLTMHLANGALFGVAYTRAARRLPGPGWARGVAAGMLEHLATWPLTTLVDRHHPARDELPSLAGVRPFLQSAWRHALFGAVLGALEARWNGGDAEEPANADVHVNGYVSTNGHGNIHHAFSGETG